MHLKTAKEKLRGLDELLRSRTVKRHFHPSLRQHQASDLLQLLSQVFGVLLRLEVQQIAGGRRYKVSVHGDLTELVEQPEV